MDTLKIGIIGYGVRARAVFVLLYGINKGKKVELRKLKTTKRDGKGTKVR